MMSLGRDLSCKIITDYSFNIYRNYVTQYYMKKIYIWLKPEFLGVRWILWKRTLSISNRFICVNYVISIPNSDINTESTNVISLIKEGKKIMICRLVV